MKRNVMSQQPAFVYLVLYNACQNDYLFSNLWWDCNADFLWRFPLLTYQNLRILTDHWNLSKNSLLITLLFCFYLVVIYIIAQQPAYEGPGTYITSLLQFGFLLFYLHPFMWCLWAQSSCNSFRQSKWLQIICFLISCLCWISFIISSEFDLSRYIESIDTASIGKFAYWRECVKILAG